MRPSFIGAGFAGTLMFIASLLFLYSYFVNKTPISSYELSSALTLASITVGIHALHHYIEEIYYGWNPLTGPLLPKE